MTTGLSTVLQNMSDKSVLVHIGPGILYDYLDYARFTGKTFVFEPDTNRCSSLSASYENNERVAIFEIACVTDNEPAKLRCYSFSILNSTNPECARLRLTYPNLHLLDTYLVDSLPAKDIESRLPTSQQNDDVLLIDRSDDAIAILDTLDQSNLIKRFRTVILRCMSVQTGGADEELDACKRWFATRYFDGPVLLNPPEFPVRICAFSRNTEKRKIARLEAALAESEHRLEQATATENLLRADLSELRDRYSETQSKLASYGKSAE